jgi:hypothetical protein
MMASNEKEQSGESSAAADQSIIKTRRQLRHKNSVLDLMLRNPCATTWEQERGAAGRAADRALRLLVALFPSANDNDRQHHHGKNARHDTN